MKAKITNKCVIFKCGCWSSYVSDEFIVRSYKEGRREQNTIELKEKCEDCGANMYFKRLDENKRPWYDSSYSDISVPVKIPNI